MRTDWHPGRQLAMWLGCLVLALVSASWADATNSTGAHDPDQREWTLDSDQLRLTVQADPYRYQLTERSTADVLLEQAATTFVTPDGSSTLASRVLQVTATDTTLDVDVALSDGSSGQVAFTFRTPDILQVALHAAQPGVGAIAESFTDQGEHAYGIWEYPFNGSIDTRGVEHDFLGLQQAPSINYSSGRAPFYVTSRKYAVYVDSRARGRFRMAIDGSTSFTFDDAPLSYDVIYGPDYASMLARYTALAGGAAMPPIWAFDSIWWKDDDHQDLHHAANAQANVLDTADQLRLHHIPAGAMWVDRPYGTGQNGWGNLDFDPSFPDPAQLVRDVNARGLRLMVWIANRAWNRFHMDASQLGYLFHGIDPALGPALDVRNPAAYDWFKAQLDAFARLGVQGYKIDRGEEGEQPAQVENESVPVFARLAAEGLAARHGSDTFLVARDMTDTGRQYAALWNGDAVSSFDGLRLSIASGLRSGAINFPMWGSDTGGYARSATSPGKELFARWLEFSAYSPLMEVLIGDHHTPWYDYDDELVAITREQASHHHDLIPYTRSALYAATQTGMPVMRALPIAFPDDPAVATLADEYLFGPALLVAPVVVEGAVSRNVYLPAGWWADYAEPRRVYQGSQTISAQAPLDRIPVFVGEGAIIPRGDIVQANNTWTPDWSPRLRIELFPSASRASTFEYFTGLGTASIRVEPEDHRFRVRLDDPGLPGELEIHLRAVAEVTRDGQGLPADQDVAFDPTTQVLRVPFAGPTDLDLDGAESIFPSEP